MAVFVAVAEAKGFTTAGERLYSSVNPALAEIHAAVAALNEIADEAPRHGTVAPGKRAVIVILDANPLARTQNIRALWRVVHDGKLVPPKNR